MAKKITKNTTDDTTISVKYPTNMWDFLNNTVNLLAQIIVLILCNPWGWVGMLILAYVILWITGGVKP